MSVFSVILLGIAVSFDGFGVGFSYGLRRVHIPLFSLLIICLSSSLSVYLSMKAGSLIAGMFSIRIASLLGGLMLVGVGFLIIRQALINKQGSEEEAEGRKDESCSRGISLLSGVLREPEIADFDCSGVITGKEAMVLGVALAMDAFGAGFGAAMMGFVPGITAFVVGVIKFFLLSAGLIFGSRYAHRTVGERAAVFSGLVLMFLGLANILA